ncbi:unnamed protein product [Chrysoparadoxa australica]
MKTAMRCAEFEDILEPLDIYSLIALAAYHSGYFGVCSAAFVKLETLQGLAPEVTDALQTLALKIFTKHQPKNPEHVEVQYMDCLYEGRAYQACTVTGQLVTSKARTMMCHTCRHFAIERELRNITHCPLCHTPML